MRRSDREITDFNEMLEVMERCDVCRLGLNDEAYPYIVPLNFGMNVKDGRVTLYFHGAAEGHKYDLMEKNNAAFFEMDCAHKLVATLERGSCTMEYESIMGHGRLFPVPEDEKYDALLILMRHYHKEDFPFNKNVMPQTRVFRLEIEEMTGKRRKVK